MGWRLRLPDKTVRKFAGLPIYCQRQKCSPGNVVSGSIRFMQLFAGVPWGGSIKWEWVVENDDFRFFRSLYLTNFHIQGHNVLCSPLVALHWHRNKWPWMTLNGHFAFKCVSLRHLMDWRFGFRRKLFGNLQSYAYTVSGKNVAHNCSGDTRVMDVFTWVTEQESVKPLETSELYLHSQ